MDSTGPTLPSSRTGAAAERGQAAPGFMGTVVSVKAEDGGQAVEVQYQHGKIRLQAQGDFQAGDRVRLTFASNGAVTMEKGALPRGGQAAATSEDWQGAGYTLPANLGALKDLRAFEEQLAGWLGGRPRPGILPAAQDKDPLARFTLPQLLMQALDRKGGKDFLAQSLAGLEPATLSALLEALEASEGEAAPKAAASDLLRSLLRAGGEAGPPAPAAHAAPADAFLTAEAGSGHAPWFGRIAERSAADGIRFAASRMGYPGPDGPVKGEALYRYVVDMGGSSLEAYSSQAREPGEFADFVLERHAGRLEARFSDPAQSLPAGLRTALAGADPGLRQGMLLASHYLQEFAQEPYYGKLVEDFGAVVAQSGLLQSPAPGHPAAIPRQEQMDNLLKLFVSFPRDAKDPAGQAKAWGEAVRDPEAFLKLLKQVRPGEEAALLRPGTPLRAAGPELPGFAGPSPAAADPSGDGPESAAAWLRKLLPEAFKSEDMLRLAKEAALPPGKEHEAAKFLLQAVAHFLPRDVPVPEGQPTPFYYYQGQEWRNLQVTWRREAGKEGRGKQGRQGPLQVKVETHSKHMGRVNVGVSWEPKGARLDFKNQHADVRELLERSLPELEKSLSLLDFKIASWTYELLPDAPAPSTPGSIRPSGLLDLRG